ncbi:MAG: Bacterial regulatory protein, gntR family [Rhodobacteraceae bacterium HLUCCA08]|nr:MAG: Bacterial regulatory protein, gntR family [Rhodobacteraceae bacterium HLUCCA08]
MRTLGQDIYAALRRDIILGRLAARRKLKMADLLDRYDASTSTLR